MKFTELTPKQQEHFLKMLEHIGEPPEGTTHVDPSIRTSSESWLKSAQEGWYYFKALDDWFNLDCKIQEYNVNMNSYPLPEKPWCVPDQKPYTVDNSFMDHITSNQQEKITSDGGSSSYYDFYIPLDRVEINEESGTVKIRLEDYIKFGLDNDFDRGNLAKANHRIGKKAGNNLDYDTNKMQYYVGQIKKNCEG